MKSISAPVKGLIFSLLAMFFAFAIYFLFLAKPNYYLVDNPTPETYYFRINNGEEKAISYTIMVRKKFFLQVSILKWI